MKPPKLLPSAKTGSLAGLCALAVLAAHGWKNISNLGFYHDDWTVFAILETGAQNGTGSLRSLMHAFPNLIYRPLDPLLWWIEHAFFGLNPLGWHLVSAALLTGVAALTGLLAIRRGASTRTAAVAAVLLISWPCKDSVQFWPGVATSLCASALWLLSELARASYESRGGRGRAAASVLAFLAGLGFYEQSLFLPLAWLFDPPSSREAGKRRRALMVAMASAIAAWFLARSLLPRLTGVSYPRPLQISLQHIALVALSMPRAHGPETFWAVLRELRLNALAAPLGAALALALPWLTKLLPEEKHGRLAAFPAYGLAIFILAYLPMAFSDYKPVPLGPENRLNLAPAIGLALAFAAWRQARARTAAADAAVLILAGLLLAASGGTARLWAEAARKQEAILSGISAQIVRWPPERELILLQKEPLAGGRAPVFLSHDSLTFALNLRLAGC